MQIEYTGRQITVTKAHHAIGDEGIERIGKILGRITTAHIVLTAEKYRQTAEVTINTRLQSIVGLCESTSMETALREAIAKAETQAIRHKDRVRAKKRKPKEEKNSEDSELARTRRTGRAMAIDASAAYPDEIRNGAANGNGRTKPAVPVTVHSFPAKAPIAEPHVVRSIDSVALRPMSLEEAVKEAEFRDREVFVFRDNQGQLKVLHRKRDGKMELIEVP
ncbi:Ribosomal subunit interface protein [Acidisarcina polymorpha]|uniref:Ribosomal subunit interface protein n=1 Tax=Acidisarcina polymorpha TaxID=2211140 RepID=A0A2Z5FZ08_9BACT|nr:ribosome-associated translation inhibitor RaiA [Acidisarcina polymorpha]AXC11764.1 Ribosomal subunit interface protein [Acidisarcina polymorpha]